MDRFRGILLLCWSFLVTLKDIKIVSTVDGITFYSMS
jgi:hypothetical protein